MNFFDIIEKTSRDDVFGNEKGFIELYQDYMRVVENKDPEITKCLKQIAYHIVNDESNINLYHYARNIDFQSIMNVIIIYDNITRNSGCSICLFNTEEYADVQGRKINQYISTIDNLKKSAYKNNRMILWDSNSIEFCKSVNSCRGRAISNLYVYDHKELVHSTSDENNDFVTWINVLGSVGANVRVCGSVIQYNSIFSELWHNEEDINNLKFTWKHGPSVDETSMKNMKTLKGKMFDYEYQCKFVEYKG